jgi:hypothetical protein
MSEESTGEFNLMAAAAELTTESGTESAPSTETQVEGQSEGNPEQTTSEEADPREILKQLAAEKPQEFDSAFLENLKALGAIHNGAPIEVKTPAELKELIQKGMDYTKKTMSHADEVRLKTEEFAKNETVFKEREAALVQKEQEIQNVVQENKLLENLLLDWKTNDPELFNFIANAYQQKQNALELQKPVIAQYENKFKELNDRFSQIEQERVQEKKEGVRQGWAKELSALQSEQAASLAKLGIVPDWEKVQKVWGADILSQMTAENALYAVHGKEITLANKSYQNLLATRNKSQASKLGRTSIAGTQKGTASVKAQPGDYESLLRQYADQY